MLQVEQRPHDPDWQEHRVKHLQRFRRASASFDESRLLIAIVCGKQTREGFDRIAKVLGQIALGLTQNADPAIYQRSQKEFVTGRLAVNVAVRKELGIEDLEF
jgi:hypothetical protein